MRLYIPKPSTKEKFFCMHFSIFCFFRLKPVFCYAVPDSVKNLTVLTDNRNATATWSTPDSQRGSTFDLYELSLQSSKGKLVCGLTS